MTLTNLFKRHPVIHSCAGCSEYPTAIAILKQMSKKWPLWHMWEFWHRHHDTAFPNLLRKRCPCHGYSEFKKENATFWWFLVGRRAKCQKWCCVVEVVFGLMVFGGEYGQVPKTWFVFVVFGWEGADWTPQNVVLVPHVYIYINMYLPRCVHVYTWSDLHMQFKHTV